MSNAEISFPSIAAETKGQSPIDKATVRLQNDLAQLHSEIDLISAKISIVCRPMVGEGPQAPPGDHTGGSNFVQLLDSLHFSLLSAMSRLSDLTQSVEL